MYLFHNNESQKLVRRRKKNKGQEINESFNYKLIFSQKWCFYRGRKGSYFILKEGNSCQPQNGTIWGNIKQQPLSLVRTEGSRRELLERLDL